MPHFSVITPVYIDEENGRQEQLQRAIKSLQGQTFGDYEHIIVNDGSPVTPIVPKDEKIKITHKAHEDRVIAYETGLAQAKGRIFCFLDSDDEYEPNYLEKVNGYFNAFPKFKLFNFGCTFVHKNGTRTQRASFRPLKKRVGHEIFGGGNIVNGTFVFHRSIYDTLGGYPPRLVADVDASEIYRYGELYMARPWDFSAYAQMEFPEIRQYFTVPNDEVERGKVIKELGNPWGNDFYIFYKYTRKYRSKPIDDYLYIVNLK